MIPFGWQFSANGTTIRKTTSSSSPTTSKQEEWGAVHYPKAEPATGWVGLSEITAHGDFVYIIERDNQIGSAAVTKKLYRVPLSEMVPAALGGELPVVSKEEVRDFMPDLAAPKGYIVDKIEGFAIDAAGNGFAVTDNDGIDDSSGETHFMRGWHLLNEFKVWAPFFGAPPVFGAKKRRKLNHD